MIKSRDRECINEWNVLWVSLRFNQLYVYISIVWKYRNIPSVLIFIKGGTWGFKNQDIGVR